MKFAVSVFSIPALLVSLLLTQASWAIAQTVSPRGTYSYWDQASPPAGGFFNLDQVVFPGNDPTTNTHGIFYSHQFAFVGGDIGYIGLQKDPGGGKKAIFSIWQALDAQGPGIHRPFGGEGTGYQTIIDYNWQPSHYYRFRVWVVSGDATGTWWVGAMIDDTAKTETQIGLIKVPAAWQQLRGGSISWVEYYANTSTQCAQLGGSVVYFAAPTANAGAQTAGPPAINYNTGVCPAEVTDYGGWQKHVNGQF